MHDTQPGHAHMLPIVAPIKNPLSIEPGAIERHDVLARPESHRRDFIGEGLGARLRQQLGIGVRYRQIEFVGDIA